MTEPLRPDPTSNPGRRSDDPTGHGSSGELTGGVVLFAATLLALLLANSPLRDGFLDLLGRPVGFGPDALHLREPLGAWVNDGLMAIFFLVVGVEINRELTTGALRDRKAAALPVVAAVGGMIVPAAIFLLVTSGTGGTRGWGIPMATDIAFVLGVVALLGPRVPSGLRLFLLTAAVVDDLGAILVIAVFYTDRVDVSWLIAAAGVSGAVLLLRRRAMWSAGPTGLGHIPFVMLGIGLWYCLFRSGVHPTIAGVMMGLAAPARPPSDHRPSVVERVEHLIGPWSSFMVLPLFALANAAVPLDGALDHASSPVAIGVVAGLVAGKAVGVGGGAWLARRTGIGTLPLGVTSQHLAGGALLTGIGFTVSLFVTELAFTDPGLVQEAKVGILVASTIAAVVGSAFLTTVHSKGARSAAVGAP